MKNLSSSAPAPSLASIRLTIAGWFGMVALGAIVALTQGKREWIFAVATATIAVVMGYWLWKRRSKAALVVTVILGGLQFIEQVSYSIADLTSNGVWADHQASKGVTTISDLFGALASGAVVAGSTSGLWQRRRNRSH